MDNEVAKAAEKVITEAAGHAVRIPRKNWDRVREQAQAGLVAAGIKPDQKAKPQIRGVTSELELSFKETMNLYKVRRNHSENKTKFMHYGPNGSMGGDSSDWYAIQPEKVPAPVMEQFQKFLDAVKRI